MLAALAFVNKSLSIIWAINKCITNCCVVSVLIGVQDLIAELLLKPPRPHHVSGVRRNNLNHNQQDFSRQLVSLEMGYYNK